MINNNILQRARKKFLDNKEEYLKLFNAIKIQNKEQIKRIAYSQNLTNLSNLSNMNNIPNSNNIPQIPQPNYSNNNINQDNLNNDILNNNNNLENISNINHSNQNNNFNNNLIPQNVIPIITPNLTGATPENIDIKNYITPETIENGGTLIRNKIKKKTESLSKIPDNLLKSTSTDWEPINFSEVDATYHLYLKATVHIYYDKRTNKVIYEVEEPKLNKELEENLNFIKKGFIYVFEKTEIAKGKEKETIERGLKLISRKYSIKLTDEEFEILRYYLIRDYLGLEKIESLMHDPYIEDISCDGLGVPIFVNHLKYGSLETNIVFNDLDLLNSFIIKLAQKANQEISLAKPILQGALPDGSRVEAIYGKEVSQKGSSFTIRKFRADPFTPIHLMDFGTLPAFTLAYLWIAIENKMSILVSGGTATGKTTMLNALSLFIPPTAKIVSIEDTPEINLPHEHWLPLVARESSEKSQVTMFDLLKASLRERPEYIIVGEIRGKEAYILFQGMATGHAGLGTVHSENFDDLVNRLTIQPISLPINLLTEVDIVLFQRLIKVKNNLVRRTGEVVEILNYIPTQKRLETNDFVTYKPHNDTFSFNERSGVINNLIQKRGGDEDSLWKEIEKRRRILDRMYQKGIKEYKDVSYLIKAYYKDPANIFDTIENYNIENEENKK